MAKVLRRIDEATRRAAAVAPGVLGFIVQCAVCPQKAVLSRQPAGEWVCPRCAEVVDPPADPELTDDDEDYLPISKVRG